MCYMNVLRFLTPKNTVGYVYDDCSLRQALEKMEYHHHSSLPIIDHAGGYVGTLTEGDLLWAIKNQLSHSSQQILSLKDAENIPISSVKRRWDNEPVTADTRMEDLVSVALNQNFVPVVDDRGVFVGIVARRQIIRYLQELVPPRAVREKSRELSAAGRVNV